MVECGFDEELIKLSSTSIAYAGWELGGTEGGRFYILPFKTNEEVYLNPGNPDFFEKLRKELVFPKLNEEHGTFWHGMEKCIPPNF
jgi:hypothetical protein